MRTLCESRSQPSVHNLHNAHVRCATAGAPKRPVGGFGCAAESGPAASSVEGVVVAVDILTAVDCSLTAVGARARQTPAHVTVYNGYTLGPQMQRIMHAFGSATRCAHYARI